MSEPHPKLLVDSRTTSFFILVTAVGVVLGVAIRARVHAGSAFPSSDPVLWQLTGIAQDLLSYGAAAMLLAAAVTVGLPGRVARVLFGLWTALLVLLSLAKSEAVILFGSALHPEDFEGGSPISAVRNSMTGYAGVLLVAVLVLTTIGLLISGRLARRVKLRYGWALAVLVCAAALVFAPIPVHRQETSASPLGTLVRFASAGERPDRADLGDVPSVAGESLLAVRELVPPRNGRGWLSEDYPLAYHDVRPQPPPQIAERPNVVIIAVENLRSAEVGAYGARTAGVTPHLDRLAAGGIRVEGAYSAGTYTPAGELGLWYGLFPVPGHILLAQRPRTTLTGLPEILRREGWKSLLWISSTDQTFFRRERFYRPRGFQMFDGNAFAETEPRVNWGVSDRVLARRAVEAMGRLEEPFAAMVLTVNNHHPYQLPPDAGPPLRNLPEEERGWVRLEGADQLFGRHAVQMLQTIHYSDQAIGDFFELARRQPWFERTIFVITGDHGVAIAPLGEPVRSAAHLGQLRHGVPLIFYSPLLEGGQVLEGPASHVDVMPTLLSMAGIRSGLTGVGVDLRDASAMEGRAVFAWSEHERVLTIARKDLVYSCRVPPKGFAGGAGAGTALPEESLVSSPGLAPVTDGRERERERFRRLARVYVSEWPRVVLSGRSGVPPQERDGSE